jgi:hypothetical protein
MANNNNGGLVPYSPQTAAAGASGYSGMGRLFSRNQLLGGALALPTVGLVATDIAQGRPLDAAGTAVGGVGPWSWKR